MKKIILSSLLLLITGTAIFSCKKESYTKKNLENSNYNYKKELNVLNGTFRPNQSMDRVDWQYWSRVAGADICGAWSGGSLGAQLGGAWGAGIGGAVGAGLCSYGAGKDHVLDENLVNIQSYNENIIFENPNNNPYDIIVGKEHNKLLKSFLLSTNVSELILSKDIASNVKLNLDQKKFIEKNYAELDKMMITFSNSSAIDNQVAFIKERFDNQVLRDFMTTFLIKSTKFSDFDIYVEYLNEFEKIVLKTPKKTLSTENRNLLLMGLSVSRYTSNFWYKIK